MQTSYFLEGGKKSSHTFVFWHTLVHKRLLNILLKKERLANADDRPLLKERIILLNAEFTAPQNRKMEVVHLINQQHMQ